MERIKHLLFLFVFLLGSIGMASAQNLRVAYPPADLDIDEITDMVMTLEKPSTTFKFDGCGATISKFIINGLIEGNTGYYRPGTAFEGDGQRIDFIFDMEYAGTIADLSTLTNGGIDLTDPAVIARFEAIFGADFMTEFAKNTEVVVFNASNRAYNAEPRVAGNPRRQDLALDFRNLKTQNIGVGYYLVKAIGAEYKDPLGESSSLSADYSVANNYYSSDLGTSGHGFERYSLIRLESTPAVIDFDMKDFVDNSATAGGKDLSLKTGCVNAPDFVDQYDMTAPSCYPTGTEFEVVFEYIGTGTSVDVIDLGTGQHVFDVADNNGGVDPYDFVIDHTKVPAAKKVGCGDYQAYVRHKASGNRVSNIDQFTICAQLPYKLEMEDWKDLVFYNDQLIANWSNPADPCHYWVNNGATAFSIWGPTYPANPGIIPPFSQWTGGPVYLKIYHEDGDMVFENVTKTNGYPIPHGKNAGLNNSKTPHTLWTGWGAMPEIALREGTGRYTAELVCFDGTVVSERSAPFTVNSIPPVEMDNITLTGCMEPICPTDKDITVTIDFESILCDVNAGTGIAGLNALRVEFIPDPKGTALFGKIDSPANPGGATWVSNEHHATRPNVTTWTYEMEPIAVGTTTYTINVYDWYDTNNTLLATIDHTFTVECCPFDPGQLIMQMPPLTVPFCNDGSHMDLGPLTAYYWTNKAWNNGSPGGVIPLPVSCAEYVGFVLEEVKATDDLKGKVHLSPKVVNAIYSGDEFELTFDKDAYGVGTYKIYPIILNDKSCAKGEKGTPVEFTIDIRRPLSSKMLERNGELFYRTNGSDAFGPMVLTNDNLPKFNPDPLFTGNVVMDIIIYDPHALVGYVANATDPFIYDFNPMGPYHTFTAIPIVNGTIDMPQIYLQNGANTQEPLYVYYGIKYADGYDCCDPNTTTATPPASAGFPNLHCASGEFYIVVKPLNNAVNQDLMATDVQADGICYGTPATNEFEVELNALYQRRPIFENGGVLPSSTKVTFRIDYVNGDELIDLATDQPKDTIDSVNPGPITWEPIAKRAGKGTYMVTPQFSENMTLTNGVPVVFNLLATPGLTPDMVGIAGDTLVFQAGQIVPAISLDANLPEGATVKWAWEPGDKVGSAEAGNFTVPTFTAKNESTDYKNLTAKYKATISYPNGGCADATANFWITVMPTVDGKKLIADKVAGIQLCKDSVDTFKASAIYNGIKAPSITTYKVEFVSGEDVATFAEAANVFTVTGARAGKGTYQLVPILLNVRGVPALFTVEVFQALDATMVGINGKTLEYKNGDVVSLIALDTQLPEGATVAWKWDVTSANVGTIAGGNRAIPAFIATNLTARDTIAKYTFKISYPNNECPAVTTGNFSIKVSPNIVEDLNLFAAPVSGKTICSGQALGDFTFNAYRFDQQVTGASFRVEFVSGDQVLNLADNTTTTTTWKPVELQTGTGTYRVVPFYENGQGTAAVFTVTILEKVSIDMVGLDGQAFVYQNGDQVPALNLDANLPEGASISWNVKTGSANIGLATNKGKSTIPSFTAYNTTAADSTAIIEFTIANSKCSAKGEFTITVKPNTIGDIDLVMSPVADNQAVCNDKDFTSIAFTAKHLTAGTAFTGKVNYVVTYVSGVNILDLTTDSADATAATAATWTPVKNTDQNGNTLAGTGIYRVTPYWNNNMGSAALFTLTNLPKVDSTYVALDNATLIYENGDQVAAISLDANLPAGAIVKWTWDNTTKDVGINAVSGNGAIPAFTARNTTGADLTATINFTVSNSENKGCVASGSFDIVVKPNTVDDLDLLMIPVVSEQAVCNDKPFKAVEFQARRSDNATFTATSAAVTYEVSFVSGTDILDLTADYTETAAPGAKANWTPVKRVVNGKAVAGTGTYRVTPIWENGRGISAVFNLTTYDVVSADLVKLNGATFTFENGDPVHAIDLNANLPAGAMVSWTLTDSTPSIGIGAVKGNSIVPAFIASNTTTADLTATVNFTVAYGTACPATGSFKLVVKPNTIEDYDLVMKPVAAGEVTCNTTDFTKIAFEAKRTDNLAFTGAVKYVVSYVGGVNVLNLTSNEISADKVASWAPIKAKDQNGKAVAGTGTYRVTPFWANGQGVPALFSLTTLDSVAIDMVGLNGVNLIYQNGDQVPAINLDANLPAGAVVTWALDVANSFPIGLSATKGNAVVPSFVANNPMNSTDISATINFTVSYGGECAKTGSFKITVQPNTVDDLDLVMLPVVAEQSVCKDANFSAVNLLAKRTDITPFSGDVKYVITFVSGTDILTLTTNEITAKAGVAAAWTPTKNGKTGTGTYRVTPVWNNNRGVSAVFNLTVLEALNADMIALNDATFTYQNGDAVQALSLDANLPAGAVVTWTLTDSDPSIGIGSTKGNAVVPGFIAQNTTAADLTATVNFTVKYGAGCPATGSFKIVVKPNTIADYDLVMTPVVDEQRICNDPNDGFAPVSFLAKRTDNAAFTGNVKYVVTYVGGAGILDLTKGYEVSAKAGEAAAWTPKQSYDRLGNPVAGTGTYRVTPYWSNGQGVPVMFTMTTYPVLDNKIIDVVDNQGKPVNFEYYNGDLVPEYVFGGTKLPAGVTIAWELKADSKKIGSATNGVNRMPAFRAINETSQAIKAEYIAWLKYDECSTKSEAVPFSITVHPKTVPDYDMHIVSLEDQEICFADKFADLSLEVKHPFKTVATPIEFQYTLVSGIDVLGEGFGTEGILKADCNPYTWEISKSTSTVVGKGTYRITPVSNSYVGASTEFTLVRMAGPTVNQVESMTLCSGSPLEVEFAGEFTNTVFDWTASVNSVGIPTKGTGNIDIYKLTNASDKAETVTIEVTPRVPGTTCPGTAMSFTVTVNPAAKANYMNNIAKVAGDKIAPELSGVATSYKWVIANPVIFENLGGVTSGEAIADAAGNAKMPEFTLANYTKELVTSKVTVTPHYGDCQGEAIEFHILVSSDPAGIVLDYVTDIAICEGEKTEALNFGLPKETYYWVTWKGGAEIGVPAAGERERGIPSFVVTLDGANKGKVTNAEVEVTPYVRYGSIDFTGAPIIVKYTVYPKFDLEDSSEPMQIINVLLSECPEMLDPNDKKDIEMTAGIEDYDKYTYQWYKNNVVIANATKSTYTLKYDGLHVGDSGDYYCLITSAYGCGGQASSVIYRVTVTENINDVVVEQLWDNVLQVNCMTSVTGGVEYVSFTWYKVGGSAVGDGKSWIKVDDVNAKYYVEVRDASGNLHTSCPVALVKGAAPVMISASPNPVNAGGAVKVTMEGIDRASISVINSTGGLVNTIEANTTETQVTMPEAAGVYILRVVPAGEAKPAEVKVIVK